MSESECGGRGFKEFWTTLSAQKSTSSSTSGKRPKAMGLAKTMRRSAVATMQPQPPKWERVFLAVCCENDHQITPSKCKNTVIVNGFIHSSMVIIHSSRFSSTRPIFLYFDVGKDFWLASQPFSESLAVGVAGYDSLGIPVVLLHEDARDACVRRDAAFNNMELSSSEQS
jgi:hypothetical protein